MCSVHTTDPRAGEITRQRSVAVTVTANPLRSWRIQPGQTKPLSDSSPIANRCVAIQRCDAEESR